MWQNLHRLLGTHRSSMFTQPWLSLLPFPPTPFSSSIIKWLVIIHLSERSTGQYYTPATMRDVTKHSPVAGSSQITNVLIIWPLSAPQVPFYHEMITGTLPAALPPSYHRIISNIVSFRTKHPTVLHACDHEGCDKTFTGRWEFTDHQHSHNPDFPCSPTYYHPIIKWLVLLYVPERSTPQW